MGRTLTNTMLNVDIAAAVDEALYQVNGVNLCWNEILDGPGY